MFYCLARFFAMARVYGWLCPLLLGVSAAGAATLDRVLDTERSLQDRAAASQQAIDALDDATREMLDEYRALQRRIELLRTDKARLEARVGAREARMASLHRQLDQVQEVRREVPELLTGMLEVLEAFVAADLPFLPGERRERLERLAVALQQPEPGDAEKYRRLLEAYAVELEYGRTIEAYTGPLEKEDGADGAVRTVEFFRLGRVGLFYRDLDGSGGGVWSQQARAWEPVSKAVVRQLSTAVEIARDRASPQFLILPLAAPQDARPASSEASGERAVEAGLGADSAAEGSSAMQPSSVAGGSPPSPAAGAGSQSPPETLQ